MTGVILRSGNIKDYKPLGEEGTPVYKSANQLRSAIQRHLGAESVKILAIPQANEDGDIIDWYATDSGSVIPWSAATVDECENAKQELMAAQQKLSEVAAKMQNTDDRERQIFGRLLKHVIQFPGDQHVYLVNGKPVLTFWGFADPNTSTDKDSLSLLNVPLAQPSVNPAPLEPVLLATDEVVPRRRFNPWWWLLLIPLLLALIFFLFRGCDQVQPQLDKYDAPVEDTEGRIESKDLDVKDQYIDRSRYTSGTRVHSTTGIDSHTGTQVTDLKDAAGQLDGQSLAEGEGKDSQQSDDALEDKALADDQTPQDLSQEDQPPDDQPTQDKIPEELSQEDPSNEDQAPPEDSTNPEDQNQTPTEEDPDSADSSMDPADPLKIPDNAATSGSTKFLDGEWEASSGLMGPTGRPLDIQYSFKNGKGQIKIKQDDGSVCTGPVDAQMSGKELNFVGGSAKCADGRTYQPSDVKCVTNASGTADCEGKYKSGETFGLDMKKAKK